MKKSIYWSSIGYKVLSLILSVFFAIITTVLFVHKNEIPLGACFISLTIFLFCAFCCFLIFNDRIVVDLDKKILMLYRLKRMVIEIKDIKAIEIDTTNSIDENKYCFVWIKLLDGTNYRLSEYASLTKKAKAVEITQQKIEILTQYLSQECK